jgi:hypothetical protein
LWRVWDEIHRFLTAEERAIRGNEPSALTWTRVKYPSPPTFPNLNIEHLQNMYNWLNYVFLFGIKSKVEIDIIMRCLKSRGRQEGQPPSWFGKDFTHQTFEVGHWFVLSTLDDIYGTSTNLLRAFYALLALPSCQDIVWCILQHKHPDEFGHKMFKSVTVFQPQRPTSGGEGDPNIVNWPALVFEVVDYSPNLLDAAEKLEKHYYYDPAERYMEFKNIDNSPIGEAPDKVKEAGAASGTEPKPVKK